MSNEKPIYVFLDTEFTQLHPVDRKLISVGACADSKSGILTYYAELSDSYELKDCSDFVKLNVLPYLDNKNVIIYDKMLLELCSFIENLDGAVVLVSDAPTWDLYFFKPMLNDVNIRPQNLVGVGQFRAGPVIPAEADYLRDHHALDDALLNLYYARQNEKVLENDGITVFHSFTV